MPLETHAALLNFKKVLPSSKRTSSLQADGH